MKYSFLSDNASGVLPEVMEFLSAEVNQGYALPYGADPYTKKAVELIGSALDLQQASTDYGVHLVQTGTAANVIALSHLVRPGSTIFAAQSSHLCMHESGAPYRLLGCKISELPSYAGKIRPQDIEATFHAQTRWGPHAGPPEVVSIAQPTEFGTVYSRDELKELRLLCDRLSLRLHMDGCRLYQAADALDVSLGDISVGAGVDALSLGGTKCGLISAEAVIVRADFDAERLPWTVKQMLNLSSKQRFLSCQYIPFFEQTLWQKAARTANLMAKRLIEKLGEHRWASPAFEVQTNQLFVYLDQAKEQLLQARAPFYPHFPPFGKDPNRDSLRGLVTEQPDSPICRMISSFCTTESEVDEFCRPVF